MQAEFDTPVAATGGLTPGEAVRVLLARWRLMVFGPLGFGLLALGVAFLIPPTFTAKTSFLPPQQSTSAAAAALASLGTLGNLAGGAAAMRNTAELHSTLLQSVTIADRIIDEFKLMEVYDEEYRVYARRKLADRTRVTLGRRDGLITIEVDDHSAERAAAMANRFVAELRRVTSSLATTEAQQRRVFFEQQLKLSRERLEQAQRALQASGFTAGALRAEPKATADSYARLRAEAAAVEVRLQALRGSLTDNAPEVRQQQATLAALRAQLAQVEQATAAGGEPDYIGRYREFKYQEALFDIYARQFELARADEAREGAFIQVIDQATPPERKSKPRRAIIAIVATLVSGLFLAIWLLVQRGRRGTAQQGLASTT